jgi:2-(1,2-epoxy-1,2-dihydrophenyl)acetyl-CoA isomerase
MRIAVETARFSQAFVRIGLIPDGGSSYFLPRLIGYARAFEMIATGEPIDALQAVSLGLINRVVPVERLDAAVDELAARLAAAPALAIAGIKRALAYGDSHRLAEALEFEAVTQKTCFESEDFREGVKAFLEKRSAHFQGR